MFQLVNVGAASLGLLVAMLLMIELGRQIGLRRLRADPDGAEKGVGAVDGAVFGLMGLLVAFTFSGAASRFDARRELILKESSAIGTAWQRLDLLPEAARDGLRAEFRRYADARLAATRAGASVADGVVTDAQGKIWAQAIAAVRVSPVPGAAPVVLPALNEMFDLATARYLATQTHPPPEVFAMLVGFALLCALLAGYGMAGSRRRSWMHILCFSASVMMAIYVVLDIEFPRQGFIRVDRYDELLVEVRAGMK